MNSSTDDIGLIKDEEIKKFIQKFKDDVPSEVVIQLSHLPIEKRNFVARQIKGRKKALEKFPFLLENENIIFPQGIAVEQSSSALTAKFKSNLFQGNKAIDLTSGFGIDSIFLSKHFEKITLTEINLELANITKYNFEILGIKNALFQNCSAEEALAKLDEDVDLIYIDPSRRVNNQKIYRVEDCQPNILEMMEIINKKTKNILIKLSPMIDISDILNKIPELTSIHIVSVENECKEILVLIEDGKSFNGYINCNELGSNSFTYSVNIAEERTIDFVSSEIKKYLYLPFVAVNKAGAFKSLTKHYEVDKISGSTHLYTSNKQVDSFPGKTYEVLDVIPYKKKALNEITKENKFNIIKRNFPDEVSMITKKLKIGHSGELYLIAYRNFKGKPELSVCRRIIA